MSYRNSLSYKTLNASISDYKRHIYATIPGKNGYSDVEIFCLSYGFVFAFTCLERYVEDVVNDWISLCHAKLTTWKDIPIEMRAVIFASPQLCKMFNNYIVDGSRKELVDKYKSMYEGDRIEFQTTRTFNLLWHKGLFLRFKYPSPDNFEKLWCSIGARSMKGDVAKILKEDPILRLTSLNDKRTAIVHDGDFPANVDKQQIDEYMRNIRTYARAVDEAFFRFVAKSTGNSTWKT